MCDGMKKIDIPFLCTKIGNLSGIPIRLYQGDALVFYHSLARLPKDPMEVYRQENCISADPIFPENSLQKPAKA